MDEELPQISSSPMLETKPAEPKFQDEVDMPALKKIQNLINEQLASYSSIDRLTVEEKDLTVKEQLAVNKAIKIHLTDVKALTDTIIDNIKEKYSGR